MADCVNEAARRPSAFCVDELRGTHIVGTEKSRKLRAADDLVIQHAGCAVGGVDLFVGPFAIGVCQFDERILKLMPQRGPAVSAFAKVAAMKRSNALGR